MKSFVLGVVFSLLALPSFSAAEDPWRALFATAQPLAGHSLPASLAGRVVVVNVWATWCQPCIKEFAPLGSLVEKYGDRVVFLAVTAEEAGLVEALLAKHTFRYVQLVEGQAVIDALVARARADGFAARGNYRPLHAVIGPDGKVRYWVAGYHRTLVPFLTREIDWALAEAASEKPAAGTSPSTALKP
ncbi:MAG: TlpA disulfide reductase family protein [Thermoanaerobaculia bacterium]|nr:TlpA disulfide reductase family protein [Thermoanaerobaculia bacterium]